VLQESHSEEKKKAAAAYRKQLKELEEQVARSRKDSAAKVRLEGLMRKSEEVVNRLKADISRMKNQKSSMLKQARTDAFRLPFLANLCGMGTQAHHALSGPLTA
jgi:hypothetical protein